MEHTNCLGSLFKSEHKPCRRWGLGAYCLQGEEVICWQAGKGH